MTELKPSQPQIVSPSFWECLGARFQLWTEDDLTRQVVEWGSEPGRRALVDNVNLHAVALMRRQPSMKEFNRLADAVHIDGMGMALLARLCGVPAARRHRITYVDWLEPLLRRAAAARQRVFFLGSRQAVAERAAEILRAKIPGLEMQVDGGYFDARPGSADNQRVLAGIRAFKPALLLVGMGMPRQEDWILAQFRELEVGAILCAGACMDYVAGAVKTPPRWAGGLSLEWLFRLAREPRRLAWRYLVEPWSLSGAIIREMLHRSKRRPITEVTSDPRPGVPNDD